MVGDRLGAAKGFEFAALDQMQQFRLKLEAERIDLVEQDGPIARQSELAGLDDIGPRVSAGAWPNNSLPSGLPARTPHATETNRSCRRDDDS